MIGPGMIRVSAAMPIPSVLGHFGIPLEPVLSDLGIRSDIFNDFENVIPYATLCRLASRCAALTKRDDFGLLVGQKGGFSSLGELVSRLNMPRPWVPPSTAWANISS